MDFAQSTLMLTGCVSVERSLVSGRKRAYGYTWQQEVQLGKESDQAIIAQYGLYDDKELADYVERLGQELLAVSHLRRDDTPPEINCPAGTERCSTGLQTWMSRILSISPRSSSEARSFIGSR